MKELIQQTFNSVLDKASQKLKESQKALEEQIQANTELKEENAKLKEVIEVRKRKINL
jgi:regulator of replication initiation timing